MTISIGEKIPSAKLKLVTEDGPADIDIAEFVKGQKVVLFAVPGAFTPTCHLNHLPGFLEHLDTIKARGADRVAVVSVNDHHVMKAWAKATRGAGKIDFLADHDASFARAMGMDVDLSIAGLGVRSVRYSMIVDDGVVKTLNLEPKPGQAEVSGASNILSQLEEV